MRVYSESLTWIGYKYMHVYFGQDTCHTYHYHAIIGFSRNSKYTILTFEFKELELLDKIGILSISIDYFHLCHSICLSQFVQ